MADIWSEKNVDFIGLIKFLSDLTVGPTYFAKSEHHDKQISKARCMNHNHSRCPWMIRRVCWCLVMTFIGGPLRAFGRSQDEAVILQSLLPDEFPDCKVGGSADREGGFRLSRGWLLMLPGLPSGFSPFPWCQRWFYSERFGFSSTKFGGVTDVHWMDWVVSIQWLQWSCTCLPAHLYIFHACFGILLSFLFFRVVNRAEFH